MASRPPATALLALLVAACAAPVSDLRITVPPRRVSAEAPPDTPAALCGLFQRETRAAREHAEQKKLRAYQVAVEKDELGRELRERLARAAENLARLEALAQQGRALPAKIHTQRMEIDALREKLARPPRMAPTVGLDALPSPLGECVTAKDGVWALVLEELDLGDVRDEGSRLPEARWVVAYAGFDGTRARRMPPSPLGEIAGRSISPHNCCMAIAGIEAARPVAFDFDDDGRTELAFGVSYLLPGLDGSPRVVIGAVYEVKDGGLADYAPADRIAVARVRDHDHDGRPDLVEQPQQEECPYDDDPTCDHECGCYPVDAAEIVWRSRPDGTFEKMR